MMKELASNLPSAEDFVRALQGRGKELASNLPLAEDFVRALQGRGADRDVLPGVALFGAGLLVGAGLALLLAPSSGEELRETLSEKIGGALHSGSEGGERETAGNGAPA